MDNYFEYRDEDFDYRYSFDEAPDKSSFHMHAHGFCELYIFLYGKGVFKVEGSEYPLSSGDIIIMRPSEAHYIDIDPSVPYERLTVNFRESYFDAVEDRNTLLRPFYDRDAGKFNHYAASSFRSGVHKYLIPNLQKNTENKHLQLVSNLLPLLYEIRTVFDSKQPGSGTETPEYKIINYVNEKIGENVTLDSICAAFFISKSQLCKTFKSLTGTTVQNYIQVKRLIRAQNLLNSGMSPTKVAYLVGYNDYSSFFRAFSRHFGMSPKEAYRKK